MKPWIVILALRSPRSGRPIVSLRRPCLQRRPTNTTKSAGGIKQASIHLLEDKGILRYPELKLLRIKDKYAAVRLSSWLTVIGGSIEATYMRSNFEGLVVKYWKWSRINQTAFFFFFTMIKLTLSHDMTGLVYSNSYMKHIIWMNLKTEIWPSQ